MSRADCLTNWPDAESGAYHPSCCRFPKSCSIESAPVPRPAEEPDREALVIEAAVEWVERIPADSWPGAWADDEDARLILAVQALAGDTRWPTMAATYAPAGPGAETTRRCATCGGPDTRPESMFRTVEWGDGDDEPAPGGGGTDLRGEVERLCDEAKPHWSAAGPGVPMVTVESLRAALAARDADQGAGADLPHWSTLPLWDAVGASRRCGGDEVENLWAALEILWPHLRRAALARATPEAD